jgi:hypothetical protein
MTKVVFRKFKDGVVIAVFPEVSYNYVHLMSYQHEGQHGDCVPWISSFTKPATPAEYAPLLSELKSIGYDDLQIMKRINLNARRRSFCQYGQKEAPAAITSAFRS